MQQHISPNSPSSPLADDEQLVFSPAICAEYGGVTDRALRKWISKGRFPQPDGNLNGRNFWLARTVRQHKADVLAGRYKLVRRSLHTFETA